MGIASNLPAPAGFTLAGDGREVLLPRYHPVCQLNLGELYGCGLAMAQSGRRSVSAQAVKAGPVASAGSSASRKSGKASKVSKAAR